MTCASERNGDDGNGHAGGDKEEDGDTGGNGTYKESHVGKDCNFRDGDDNDDDDDADEDEDDDDDDNEYVSIMIQ